MANTSFARRQLLAVLAGGATVRVLVACGIVTAAGCKRSSATTSSAVDATAGVDVIAAPPATLRVVALASGDTGVCAQLESRETRCLTVAPREQDFSPRAWRVIPGEAGKVVEIAGHGACLRYEGGRAVCARGDAEEAFNRVRSFAAYPLLLDDSGTVRNVSTNERLLEPGRDRHWTRLAQSLSHVRSVSSSRVSACALLESGAIQCWSDPACVSAEDGELPLHGMRGVEGVTEMFVGGWHTLCVCLEAGRVRCSAPLAFDTEVCAPRGAHRRCGPLSENEKDLSKRTLAGAGYDQCDAIARRLVAVPNVTGAVRIAPYLHDTYVESTDGVLFVSDIEDGGCAELADGSLACFEPSRCEKGRPWHTQRVVGLPRVRRWRLGADEGYATGDGGELYTWPRRAGIDAKGCSVAPTARRMDIAQPIADFVAGYVPELRKPGYAAGGCATTTSGALWCWTTTDRHEPKGLTRVSFAP